MYDFRPVIGKQNETLIMSVSGYILFIVIIIIEFLHYNFLNVFTESLTLSDSKIVKNDIYSTFI